MSAPSVQCPRCFGRGYQPEARKNGGPGFYARNCPRCQGSGQIEEPAPRYSIATAIRKHGERDGYEIQARDVGRIIGDNMGRVARCDVGKRVFVRDFGVAMENAEQRDARKLPRFGGAS